METAARHRSCKNLKGRRKDKLDDYPAFCL